MRECGRDFGQGETGYSDRQCGRCKWSRENEDRLQCCCYESSYAWSDVEATDCCDSFLHKDNALKIFFGEH
jgi:hypothetical protein